MDVYIGWKINLEMHCCLFLKVVQMDNTLWAWYLFLPLAFSPWSNVTKLCSQFGTYALFYICHASLCTSLVSPLITFTLCEALDLLCFPSLPHCGLSSLRLIACHIPCRLVIVEGTHNKLEMVKCE